MREGFHCVYHKSLKEIFLFALVSGVPALGFAEMKKEFYPSCKLEYEFSYGKGEI